MNGFFFLVTLITASRRSDYWRFDFKNMLQRHFLTGVGAVGKVRVITEEDSYQLTKKQLHVSGSIKALVDF